MLHKLHLSLIFLSLLAIAGRFIAPEPWGNYGLMLITLLGGVPLLASILQQLVKKDFGADLLAGLALVTAAVTGDYLVATLIVLMLASGQALEQYASTKASNALAALASRMPSVAHRQQGHQIEDIALGEVRIGDAMVVYPHETCPVDGVVISGHGTMDESYLTGEPYQMSKAPGAAVLSGAINGEAVLVIRAEALPEDSRYAQIMRVMEAAEQKRPRLRRLADQWGMVLTPVALMIAGGAWWISGEVERFLAVLTIATPCPLLIAVPITIVSAISLAAKRGIIVRDPLVLERLPTCRTAFFDKTGTLTYGRPSLTEILPVAGLDEQKLLSMAASLERFSKHPLAGAIVAAAKEKHLWVAEAENVSEKAGQGLVGRVEGKEVAITHRNKLSDVMKSLLPAEAGGLECVLLVDGAYAAVFRFRDAPRAEGKSFIRHLGPAHRFDRVVLLSGDRLSEVQYLADQLGITEVYASQSPEQKLTMVREEAARRPTLFMGDGINDAPALAAATVGLAFGQHSSVTSEAAGAVILDNTLMKVDELIHISHKMRQIALQSAIGGIVLSVIGMGFAAAGILSPVMGALLQEAIDVLAIANALRLAWRPEVVVDMEMN
jgi:heavy metal translocating P-type ATPase